MKHKEFKTQDIVLASCLKLTGYDMIRIEKDGSKGLFVFADVDEQFIQDFDLEKITVKPIAYHNTVKQLTTSVRRLTARN